MNHFGANYNACSPLCGSFNLGLFAIFRAVVFTAGSRLRLGLFRGWDEGAGWLDLIPPVVLAASPDRLRLALAGLTRGRRAEELCECAALFFGFPVDLLAQGVGLGQQTADGAVLHHAGQLRR